MANRLIGNVFIIDSASGNAAMGLPNASMISSVAFWSTTTAGKLILAGTTTTDHLVILEDNSKTIKTLSINLDGCRISDSIKVPVLTAGTAWIYLK